MYDGTGERQLSGPGGQVYLHGWRNPAHGHDGRTETAYPDCLRGVSGLDEQQANPPAGSVPSHIGTHLRRHAGESEAQQGVCGYLRTAGHPSGRSTRILQAE